MGEKEGPPQPTVKCTLSFRQAMPKHLLALAQRKAGGFWLCYHSSPPFVCKFRMSRNEKMLSGVRVGGEVARPPLVLPALPHGP